jgi:hypothetical protein
LTGGSILASFLRVAWSEDVAMKLISRILDGPLLVAILIALAGSVDSAFAVVGGAPGPVAGAGLPILVIGYGAYWLVKRLRRKPH